MIAEDAAMFLAALLATSTACRYQLPHELAPGG